MTLNPLLRELEVRGFIFDCTDLDGLSRRLDEGPTRVYVGFDPTADSLHVGSLMPLFAARLLQQHGHVPVLLIGGATGMIGDPSGRSAERNLLDDAQLDANRTGLQAQITTLVPPVNGEVLVVDNRDWIGPMTAIELLRDAGRHFSVGSMLAKESVKLRRDAESGITFTEFAYQVLQAFDFWWLRTNLDVEVQIGGSDQWGNITAGTEFMRRKDGSSGFGLVWPLLKKADGTKFGKTADGNVWLDARRTSPFDFWQFWFNTDDADVETMLLRFASLSPASIDDLMEQHRQEPAARRAQRVLADNVTAWVHGVPTARAVACAADVVFGHGTESLDAESLDAVEQHMGALRMAEADLIGLDVGELAVRAGLCSSNGDARRLISGGGLRLGEVAVASGRTIEPADVAPGWFLLRKGRRTPALVRVAG
jgi:tyrosyl-tRNA synthetase